MSPARFIVGDVFDVMATLPDGSVDLIVTSPPFLALRSYLPPGHPDKHKEIGGEPTPAAFIDTLLALTGEWRRLLAPHGSICVELGDTYSGSGGAGGDYGEGGLREGQERFDGSASRAYGMGAAPRPPRKGRGMGNGSGRDSQHNPVNYSTNGRRDGWPMPKSMCGIPHLYHLSLAYGRNLLTGEESPAGQWRVRNVVAWCRPNPPVGALGDKFRPATSYMTIACVSKDRYFDLDAVRQPHADPRERRNIMQNKAQSETRGNGGDARGYKLHAGNPAGAPPLDYWEIPTQPYAGSHYAVFPPALITRPIQAMCPERVCTTCGQPSRRIVDAQSFADGEPSSGNLNGRSALERGREPTDTHKVGRATFSRVAETIGWTDCGHDAWRNGIVLDPFAGSGTTLAVASGHGRDAIGIDLDARNADLARERVGMFLTVERLHVHDDDGCEGCMACLEPERYDDHTCIA